MAIAVPKRRLFGRTKRPGEGRETLVGYAFVFVPMVVFLLFFIYPMGYAVYISRFDWGILGPLNSLGWKNYSSLWHDTLFRRSIKNTLEYTVWVVPSQMALGLLLAVVVNQKIRARTFFRGAFYFPSLASSAAIDGAGPWRTFWKVTFPLLKPGHFFVAVVSIIGAMKLFDQAYIISRGTGGPDYATYTVVLDIFNTAIKDAQLGLAAAMGVVLFIVIFAFTIIQWVFFGRQEAA